MTRVTFGDLEVISASAPGDLQVIFSGPFRDLEVILEGAPRCHSREIWTLYGGAAPANIILQT